MLASAFIHAPWPESSRPPLVDISVSLPLAVHLSLPVSNGLSKFILPPSPLTYLPPSAIFPSGVGRVPGQP